MGSAAWPQTPGKSANDPSLIDLVHLLLADKAIDLIHRLLQRGVKAVAPGWIRDGPGLAALLAATAFAPLGGLKPQALAGEWSWGHSALAAHLAPLGGAWVCWKWRRRVAGRRFGHAHRRLLLLAGDDSAIMIGSGLGPTR